MPSPRLEEALGKHTAHGRHSHVTTHCSVTITTIHLQNFFIFQMKLCYYC